MRKNMEEEIRAQLEANMAMIGSNATTWEERVRRLSDIKFQFTMT